MQPNLSLIILSSQSVRQTMTSTNDTVMTSSPSTFEPWTVKVDDPYDHQTAGIMAAIFVGVVIVFSLISYFNRQTQTEHKQDADRTLQIVVEQPLQVAPKPTRPPPPPPTPMANFQQPSNQPIDNINANTTNSSSPPTHTSPDAHSQTGSELEHELDKNAPDLAREIQQGPPALAGAAHRPLIVPI